MVHIYNSYIRLIIVMNRIKGLIRPLLLFITFTLSFVISYSMYIRSYRTARLIEIDNSEFVFYYLTF